MKIDLHLYDHCKDRVERFKRRTFEERIGTKKQKNDTKDTVKCSSSVLVGELIIPTWKLRWLFLI